MSRFSDRLEITEPPSLSRDEMPDTLRMALWNHLQTYMSPSSLVSNDFRWHDIAQKFYLFNHMALDELTYDWPTTRQTLKRWWFDPRREWYDIYNVIEVLASPISEMYAPDRRRFYVEFNRLLESEGSRFRFIEGQLTEITDNNEANTVDAALSAPNKFAGARAHIADALRFLGQRPVPDYRNSIQESISAVESTLKVLTGLDHADFSDALRAFSSAHPIHGALVKGLSSLYGYTSNEHGIRHALLEGTANVGFSEAKFMVVACAAFVNFLIAKDAP